MKLSKLGFGGCGYVPPIQDDPVQLCALVAYLQRQRLEIMVIEVDPYGLPDGFCEAHLFQAAAFAETHGIPWGECTVEKVLVVIQMTQQEVV